MCGICGIWGRTEPEAVEKMVEAMRHRGPSDKGVYHAPGISLGMTRLAVIDLSDAAHQPMHNEAGTVWIVYNGEAYNFREGRKELEKLGYVFRSKSDTEVVLKLYEHYGDDFLHRLRGMFALAIYDKRGGPGRERLLLARDHLGIKPLLFARIGNSLVFASEMKAILSSGLVSPTVDPISLRLLLTYGSVYQPRTMVEGVKMLLPAHRLIVQAQTERIERYWSLGVERIRDLGKAPYEELVERVAETLEESVRLQMVSDVPVGAFLSGGVDSSLLVGLMSRAAGQQVKTFSVGFEEEGAGLDETAEAEQSALFLGADHTRVVLNGSNVRDRIEHIASALDQPSVDGVNSYFVSLAAKQSVTVAISGTGGDELFAGYPWFAEMAHHEWEAGKSRQGGMAFLCDRLSSLPLLRTVLSKNETAHPGPDQFLRRYRNTYHIFDPQAASALLAAGNDGAERFELESLRGLRQIDELHRTSAVERVSALCLRGYTANQLLRDIDAVSMAHSLEVRVPFLDVPLTDLALSLPRSAKLGDISLVGAPFHSATYRDTGSKKILIDAGKRLGILPDSIECQPKRGFTLPLDRWLKGPLGEVLLDTLSPGSVKARGLLEPKAVEEVKNQFFEGILHWTRPWLLVVLELWCREVLEKASLGWTNRPAVNG